MNQLPEDYTPSEYILEAVAKFKAGWALREAGLDKAEVARDMLMALGAGDAAKPIDRSI